MVESKQAKTNGFALRSLHDVALLVSILAPILTVLVGVILWGLKLEDELNTERLRIDQANRNIAELRQRIAPGILPRAEERIRALESALDKHEDNNH